MHDITDRIITLSSLFDDMQHDRRWHELVTPQQAEQIAALFDAEALENAVWHGLGNLHALPWIYHAHTNDVTELMSRGAVTVTGRSLGAQWRGVLIAWLTGNQVTVLSEFVSFWQSLATRASQLNVFVPFEFSLGAALDVGSVTVSVPELALQKDKDCEGPVILYQVSSGAVAPYPLALDFAAAWSAVLVEKVRRVGVSLTSARQQLSARQKSLRLDSRMRFLFFKTKRLPYYRQLPQPGTMEKFSEFPVLTKAILEKNSPPQGNSMASGALPSGEVLVSGSSGGQKRYIPYSQHDWQSMVQEAVQVLYDVGLTPGDKVVNTLYGGHMYGGMLTSSQELAQMPVESYTVGQNVTPDELVHLRRTFGINAIIGIPSLLETLLSEAKRIDPEFRLEKVIYGGAPWQESRKRWLREELCVRVVRSILAANDGAQIGYQTESLQRTEHFLVDDYNYVEIVDDDGKPVPDGQRGNILITNWQKFEYPLIRYKIGDVGRIVPGEQGRILEFLGRSDGLIILNGRHALYYQDVVDALAHVAVSQLQLTISRQQEHEILRVNLESQEPLDMQILRQRLIEALPALRPNGMVSEHVLQFRVEVVQVGQGELTRNPVSGKVRLVEDLRMTDLEMAS